MQQPQISEPNLENILDTVKQNIFFTLNCHRIGIIQEFDATKQLAKIQLVDKMVVQSFNQPDKILDFSPLIDVPVIIVGGGEGWIDMPIAKGDECLVLFNDRDIDAWQMTGAVQKPKTNRVHDFSDAVAIIGLHSALKYITNFDQTSLGLRYKDAKISILQDGSIEISSDNTNIDVSNAISTISILGNGNCIINSGADIDLNASGLIAIKNTAQSLYTILDTFLTTMINHTILNPITGTFTLPMNPADIATLTTLKTNLSLLLKP